MLRSVTCNHDQNPLQSYRNPGTRRFVRVAVGLYLGNTLEETRGGTYDQISYDMLAQRVAGGHGFSFAVASWPYARPDQPTAFWSYLYTLFYTLFLAGVYAVAGHHPLAAPDPGQRAGVAVPGRVGGAGEYGARGTPRRWDTKRGRWGELRRGSRTSAMPTRSELGFQPDPYTFAGDEAGDASFRFDRGSSTHFVIALIGTQQPDEMRVALAALRSRLQLASNFEFKLHRLGQRRIQDQLWETLAPLDFRVWAIVVDKTRLADMFRVMPASAFYTYFMSEAIRLVPEDLRLGAPLWLDEFDRSGKTVALLKRAFAARPALQFQKHPSCQIAERRNGPGCRHRGRCNLTAPQQANKRRLPASDRKNRSHRTASLNKTPLVSVSSGLTQAAIDGDSSPGVKKPYGFVITEQAYHKPQGVSNPRPTEGASKLGADFWNRAFRRCGWLPNGRLKPRIQRNTVPAPKLRHTPTERALRAKPCCGRGNHHAAVIARSGMNDREASFRTKQSQPK